MSEYPVPPGTQRLHKRLERNNTEAGVPTRILTDSVSHKGNTRRQRHFSAKAILFWRRTEHQNWTAGSAHDQGTNKSSVHFYRTDSGWARTSRGVQAFLRRIGIRKIGF